MWEIEELNEIAILPGIRSITFSPDGKIFASIGGRTDSTIHLWDVAELKEIAVLEGHTGGVRVRSITFSPDGKILASAGDAIRLWNVEGGKEIAVLEGHTRSVLSVTFSPDGKRFTSLNWDQAVCLWDVAKKKEIAILGEYVGLAGHANGCVNAIAFSPDGKTLASGHGEYCGGWDGVRLWDIKEQKVIAAPIPYTYGVHSVSFSPDGKTLVFSSANVGHLKVFGLWDVAEQREIAALKEYRIYSAAFSPDGKILALGVSEGVANELRLWDTARQEWIASLDLWEFFNEPWGDEWFNDAVTAVAFSPDGRKLAWGHGSLGGGDQTWTIRLWEIPERGDIFGLDAEIAVLEGHTGMVDFLEFGPDGKTLISRSADGTVCLLDVVEQKEFAVLRPGWMSSVALSLDKEIFASVSGDWNNYTVSLWDVSGQTEIATFSGQGEIFSVALSPDGKTLALGCGDGLHLWDIEGGMEIAVLRGNHSYATSVSFSPDGEILASGREDGTILLWERVPPTSIEPKGKKVLTWGQVKNTELLQNYPNPFNPETWIPFELAGESDVVLRIYDVKGSLVREISLGRRLAGSYTQKNQAIYWDGKNDRGEHVASGLYFYTLQTGGVTSIRKMTLVR